jgi:hypothetical protein
LLKTKDETNRLNVKLEKYHDLPANIELAENMVKNIKIKNAEIEKEIDNELNYY